MTNSLSKLVLAGLIMGLLVSSSSAQTRSAKSDAKAPAANLPEVTVIDQAGLKKAIQPNGKPLLVNFWATWCDPCREEFPDLVKINAAYRDKIDFITISLDDLAELKRDVPKFLSQMKADMPAYLLKVPDEGAAISSVYKDWTGGLPFTILFDKDGKMAYSRQGKVVPAMLTSHIDRLVPQTIQTP